MEGFTPPNSPKYCKSCIRSAGLKSAIVKEDWFTLIKIDLFKTKSQYYIIYINYKSIINTKFRLYHYI